MEIPTNWKFYNEQQTNTRVKIHFFSPRQTVFPIGQWNILKLFIHSSHFIHPQICSEHVKRDVCKDFCIAVYQSQCKNTFSSRLYLIADNWWNFITVIWAFYWISIFSGISGSFRKLNHFTIASRKWIWIFYFCIFRLKQKYKAFLLVFWIYKLFVRMRNSWH